MIAQFFSFSFITIASFTTGSLLKKLTRWNTPYIHDFLIGFAICNALFTLLSIYYPINDTIVILFSCLLIGTLILFNAWLLLYFQNVYVYSLKRIKENFVCFSLAAIYIPIIFFKSMYQPSLHYDAGLYHIQTIKWIEEYPPIAGIANLNYTFGYNFNIFTWYAVSSFQTLFKQPVYAINFTLLSIFSVWVFFKTAAAVKSKNYLYACCLMLVIYSMMYHFLPHISTTTTNTPVFVLLMVIVLSLVNLEKNKDIFCSIIILSIYSITIKLSAVPISILTIYALIKSFDIRNRKYICACILSLGILIPWLIKNVILTGWLLYPFPNLDLFSFDWKVPINDVVSAKEVIKNFSQGNSDSPTNPWLKQWLYRQTAIDLCILFIIPIIVYLLLIGIYKKKILLNQYYLIGFVTSILGVLFMFLSSPSLSYSIAFFLSILLLYTKIINLQAAGFAYVFYTISFIISVAFLKDNWYHPWHFIKHIDKRIIVPYSLDDADKNKFAYFLIDNKVKCYYPIGSDQCFDQPLPCTYKIMDRLHLRGETIDQGFYRGLKKAHLSYK